MPDPAVLGLGGPVAQIGTVHYGALSSYGLVTMARCDEHPDPLTRELIERLDVALTELAEAEEALDQSEATVWALAQKLAKAGLSTDVDGD